MIQICSAAGVMKVLLTCLILFGALRAYAGLGADASPPNERNPEYYESVTQHAQEGTAIVVGAERGLLLASRVPWIIRLIQIDRDDDVLRLNRINRALIKIARDRVDYLRLRAADDFSIWSLAGFDSELTPLNFKWWQGLIKSHYLETEPRDIDGDYMGIDAAFSRIQYLARADRIDILKLNLNDSAAFQRLLRDHGSDPISLVDLSNTWWESYLGPIGTLNLVRSSEPLVNARTIWLFSNLYGSEFWTYFGFHTASLIRQFIPFTDLASVTNTGYHGLLAEMRPIAGLNPDLSNWLPPTVSLENPTEPCSRLLRGQVEFIQRKIRDGREGRISE